MGPRTNKDACPRGMRGVTWVVRSSRTGAFDCPARSLGGSMAAMSFGRRVAFAFRCFFALLFKGIVPADIVEVVAPSAPRGAAARPAAAVAPARPAAAADDPGDRAIQLLALFQRDGRLV